MINFNKDNYKDIIDSVTFDTLAPRYSEIQNTMIMLTNAMLQDFNNLDPKEWKQNQYKLIPKVKGELNKYVLKQKHYLKKEIEDASKMIGLSKSATTSLINEQNKALNNAVKVAINNYQSNVNFIARAMLTGTIDIPSERTAKLYKKIVDQTKKGIDKGIKITYSKADGTAVRNVSFKTYMEMLTRTTFNDEVNNNLINYGDNAGIIFYKCNSFSDCALDHREYQGKIYVTKYWKSIVDPEIKDQVEEVINSSAVGSKGIKFIQDVMSKPVWLTTRPNCRHKFSVLNTLDVINGKVSKDATLNTKDNYKALQQQRANERAIRESKVRLDNAKQNLAKAPAGADTTTIQNDINRYKSSVRHYQAKQRELLEMHPELHREYQREKTNYLVGDLGARYRKEIDVK